MKLLVIKKSNLQFSQGKLYKKKRRKEKTKPKSFGLNPNNTNPISQFCTLIQVKMSP